MEPALPPCSRTPAHTRSLPNFRTPELPNFRTPKLPRAGFTLLELLLVMVVIAILGTIIMGSATFVTRLARVKRAEVARTVLATALARYRSDYNAWPDGGIKPNKDGEIIATNAMNAMIFGMLREGDENTSNPDNPRGIRYLDESTVFTVDKDGQPVMLARAGTGDKPLIYIARESGRIRYFKVVINVDNDSADVTWELKDWM
jgi:prepilin-type N-terminal cleavage/methylation domain-containing protein